MYTRKEADIRDNYVVYDYDLTTLYRLVILSINW